jgi:hypothetical protein
MSGSPQSEAAGAASANQAQLSKQLSGVALPALSQNLGTLSGMLGSRTETGQLGIDANVRNQAIQQLNSGYQQAGQGQAEAINYGAMRSGEGRLGPGVVSSAIGSAATGLERDRQQALRNLEFMSAQSSMSDYNQILSLLGQGTNQALGLGQGFAGNANSAIGGMSQNSQFGSVLGGAASGAALGSTIYPGWGTVIGGVVGGVAGGLAGG